jgi:hypothetical protein
VQKLIPILFILAFLPPSLFGQIIGIIEEVQGSNNFIQEDQSIQIEEYDDLILGQKIQVADQSKITLSLNDGTIFIFENESEFFFNTYNDLFSVTPSFEITVVKGNFIVETGDIPKIVRDQTKIFIPGGELILNGTAVAGNMTNAQSDVFLLTDSFGEKGELKLQTQSGQSIDIAADSGLQLQGESVTPKQVDDQKINQMQNLKQAIVNVAVVDEEKIEQIMQKKIASGKLTEDEVEKLKEKVIGKKAEKLNSIIQNTKENSSLLGDVISNSKEDQAGSVLEKIMADKPEITGSVMNDVISANPEKLESITKDNEDLLTNIVKTVVAEASDGDESIGNIISKASPDITSKMMTEITETKQELAAQVIAQVSQNNPNKISEIFEYSEELATSLTEAVANSIVNDVDGSDTFKKIFVAADARVLSKVSAAVNQQDASITQKAVAELIIEDKEAVKNVIKKAAKAGANDIAESTMKTAILQGETTMVQEAVIELTQETTNQNNNASSASIQQADDIEEELIDPISNLSNSLNNSIAQAQEENPDAEILIEEEIIVNLNTVLASPS